MQGIGGIRSCGAGQVVGLSVRIIMGEGGVEGVIGEKRKQQKNGEGQATSPRQFPLPFSEQNFFRSSFQHRFFRLILSRQNAPDDQCGGAGKPAIIGKEAKTGPVYHHKEEFQGKKSRSRRPTENRPPERADPRRGAASYRPLSGLRRRRSPGWKAGRKIGPPFPCSSPRKIPKVMVEPDREIPGMSGDGLNQSDDDPVRQIHCLFSSFCLLTLSDRNSRIPVMKSMQAVVSTDSKRRSIRSLNRRPITPVRKVATTIRRASPAVGGPFLCRYRPGGRS